MSLKQSRPSESARYVAWAWKDDLKDKVGWCCRNPMCVLEVRLTRVHVQQVWRARNDWWDETDHCTVCRAIINWPGEVRVEVLP